MIVRTRADDVVEDPQIGFRKLGGTVVVAAIPQRRLAVLAKALGDTVDSGVMDLEDGLDRTWRAAIPKVEENQITQTDRGDPALLETLAQLLLDEPRDFGENSGQGNSSLGPRRS